MPTVTVNPTSGVPRNLAALYRRAHNKRGLLGAIGGRARLELQMHFQRKNAQPNKRGWPKSNFYAREGVRKVAEIRIDEAAPSVSVPVASRPMALRYRGGEIRAAGGKMLAIPLRPEAKVAGRPALGRIPGLFFVRGRTAGRAFLATRESGALRIYYMLTPKVRIPADKSVLPTRRDLMPLLVGEARRFLHREEAAQ